MKIYKYKNKKLKEIFYKEFNEENHIYNIFKLFNEKYILIQFLNNSQIIYESKLNFYEIIFEFNYSHINNLAPIDNFQKSDEIYFYAEINKDFIQFRVNSKNEIIFNLKYLPIIGQDYKFISDEKFLIKFGKMRNYSYVTKYIVYDIKNSQIENVVWHHYLLKNRFKRIKGKYKLVLKEILYNVYDYGDYFVLKRNKDEIIFINKEICSRIFTIFKYTYNTNLNPKKKEKEKNSKKKTCIAF